MIGKPGSLWWRNLSADFRSNFRVLAAWVYGLQAFVVVPMFLGAIYRGEQSLWVWKEYARDVARHGQVDAAFGVYLYVVFYAALWLVPYFALNLRYSKDDPYTSDYFRERRFLLSCWFAGTFLLFAQPLFAFIRSVPTYIWDGWLIIFWIASAIVAVFWLATLERRKAIK